MGAAIPTLLVKPAGGDCNLRCSYCFYRPGHAPRPGKPPPRMDAGTLERLLAGWLALPSPVHVFVWQGGEPALMGAGFFRRVTALQERLARPGTVIGNALQTNGTLLDDELAAHLAAYRFLVGVSLDGPPDLHDRHRRDPAGEGSHARAAAAVARLRRHGLRPHATVLVGAASAGRAAEICDHLLGLGLSAQHHIPCADLGPGGRPAAHAIAGEAWGDYLCELFDHWHPRRLGTLSIRLFDSLLERLAGGPPSLCTLAADCRQHLVVEHDGSLYPCDFHVEPRLRLGSVRDEGWTSVLASEPYARFGRRKGRLPAACRDCGHLDLCGGDCPRLRPDPERPGALCAGWRRFLDHARGRLRELAAPAAAARAAAFGAEGAAASGAERTAAGPAAGPAAGQRS